MGDNIKESNSAEFKKKLGFFTAVLAMIVVYAASSAPIPIYSTYQILLDITKANLSMTAVAYFLGTVISLLFFGKVSDYIGRRKTIIITLIVAISGCLLFLFINSFTMFLLARLVQGLACGLASSCIAAYMVDTTPEGSMKLAAILTSGSTMIGLTLGSFGSASIITLSTSLISWTYMIIIALLILCIFLIIFSAETVEIKNGVSKVIRPHVEMPANTRKLFIPASAIFVGTWAVGGFYQAFSSTIATEQFGVSSALLAALIFSSLMAPQILGNTLIKYIDDVKAQKMGMILFSIAMILIVYSFTSKNVLLFIILSILSALFIGISFASSMEILLSNITTSQRAGVLSTIYLISYGGPAIINFIVGRIGNNYSLVEITIGYTIIVIIATIITVCTSKNN